jgi:prepilin-type N-terminal cleavage/methylation domain-containing protein
MGNECMARWVPSSKGQQLVTKQRPAFTIIELLVVITIVVVLLALLAPAMDQAIYQAELARCAAQLKQIGTAATTYAVDFRNWYPHRPTVNDNKATTTIRHGDSDDRPVFRGRIPLNLMLDPLVPKVDLNGEAPHIQSSFTSLWFGTRYPGHKGMNKLGDRFEWTTTGAQPTTYAFNLLASDSDYFLFPNGDGLPNGNGLLPIGNGFASTSHMDEKSSMALNHFDDSNFISSYWYLNTPAIRGPVDFNYALADGSILRLNKVKTNLTAAENDDRVVSVPFFYSAWEATNVYQQVPRP